MLMIEGFPHPSIPQVNGVLTYETIKMVQRMLSTNTASVHLNIGDGMNRLLALTVDAPLENIEPTKDGLAVKLPDGR